MGQKKLNIYNLSSENLRFLKVFQFFGFLPIQLTNHEKIFAWVASIIVTVFIALMILLRCLTEVGLPYLAILFVWDVIMLLVTQLLTWLMIHRHQDFFTLLGEIDERIKNVLGMGQLLMVRNVRLQRLTVTTWAMYGIASLYFPMSRFMSGQISPRFYDSLFRLVSWSFLVHINKMKFLYLYALIAVRLEVIKQCLGNMQREKFLRQSFVIKELSRDKFARNITQYSKIMALKEIYDRCWLLQGHVYQLSGVFLLIYFIGYTGQIIYVMFYYIKPSILDGKFSDQFLEIILWLVLLNVFTVSYFYVSHKINSKGLKISGLIHNIAHDSFNDQNVVQAVKLFSMQIMQQPMTSISIFGLFSYDRTNLNGVLILYSSLFYEALHINVKMIDLKQQAKILGIPDVQLEPEVKSVTI